jgi:hypothetical protein
MPNKLLEFGEKVTNVFTRKKDDFEMDMMESDSFENFEEFEDGFGSSGGVSDMGDYDYPVVANEMMPADPELESFEGDDRSVDWWKAHLGALKRRYDNARKLEASFRKKSRSTQYTTAQRGQYEKWANQQNKIMNDLEVEMNDAMAKINELESSVATTWGDEIAKRVKDRKIKGTLGLVIVGVGILSIVGAVIGGVMLYRRRKRGKVAYEDYEEELF